MNFIRPREQGNVLFLILIAVALFAALSYAITSSSRTSDGNTKKDKTALCVSQINSMLAGLDTEIMRIRYRGYQLHEIDYSTNQSLSKGGAVLNGTSNASCTSNDCRIFNDKGGSFALPKISAADCGPPASDGYWSGSAATGHVTFNAGKIPNVGSANTNSLFITVNRVNREVCGAFNTQNGLGNWNGGGIANSGISLTGTLTEFPAYTSDTTGFHLQASPPNIAGSHNFCFRNDFAFQAYSIIHVSVVQ